MRKHSKAYGKKYDKMILDKLLSKYERSKVSRGANQQAQNVWFTVTEKSLPEYFDLTSDACEVIHRDVQALVMAGLAEAVWKNGIEGHILEKVKLNLSAVDEAYAYLGRIAKNVQIEKLFAYMDSCTDDNGDRMLCAPVEKYFAYIRRRLCEGLSVKKYVDFNDLDRFADVVKGAAAVLSNEGECFEREFSMAVYGDSKRFEELKSTIKAVLTDFGNEDSGRIFEAYGILEKPSTVLLKGCGTAVISDAAVDLSALPQGIGFAGDDLGSVAWAQDKRVRQIITIENLTAFYRFSQPEAVIVYLGGFSNRVRADLLKRLHLAYPSAELLHFGDIDLGGFRIFLDLRRKSGLDIKPLHVDVSVLEQYEDMCRPLTKEDKKGLSKMLEEPDSGGMPAEYEQIIKDSVLWMLEHNLKLEQEIVVYEMVKKQSGYKNVNLL